MSVLKLQCLSVWVVPGRFFQSLPVLSRVFLGWGKGEPVSVCVGSAWKILLVTARFLWSVLGVGKGEPGEAWGWGASTGGGGGGTSGK
jgi:hypothetical protein